MTSGGRCRSQAAKTVLERTPPHDRRAQGSARELALVRHRYDHTSVGLEERATDDVPPTQSEGGTFIQS